MDDMTYHVAIPTEHDIVGVRHWDQTSSLSASRHPAVYVRPRMLRRVARKVGNDRRSLRRSVVPPCLRATMAPSVRGHAIAHDTKQSRARYVATVCLAGRTKARVTSESTPIILEYPPCLTPPVSRSWTPTHPPHLPPAPHQRRRAYLVLPLRARPSPAPRTRPKTKLYFQLRGIHTSFRTSRRPPKANQSSTFHPFSPRFPPPTLLLPTLPPVRRRHARASHQSTPRRSHYIRRYTPSGHWIPSTHPRRTMRRSTGRTSACLLS
jgi:hypothetical protein